MDDLSITKMNLKNQNLLVEKGYINGVFTSGKSNKTFPVYNPASGECIANLPDMGVQETKEAIDVAERAQKDWASKTGKERSVIIRKWYDLIIENKDDLAIILTTEMGKPMVCVGDPFNGEEASYGNGTMVAIQAGSRENVDKLYSKAISLGAKDEGGPGERNPAFYGAYFRDLDGNKIVVCHMVG